MNQNGRLESQPIQALTGLHILLTYACNYECDHCFVFGSPWQSGTFTLAQLEDVFKQAKEVESIDEIYFEGGEAFLYYPILVEAVNRATRMGFSTGLVTNSYWATAAEDAWTWLQPLAAAGLDNVTISCDTYHGDGEANIETHPALIAAGELFMDSGAITVNPPLGYREPDDATPGLPLTGGGVMFRGRAAEKLTTGLPRKPWTTFTTCPYEDLVNPSRVHLDPFGNLHLCQGIVMGNLFERPLKTILADYDPESHPIVGPLVEGGPARLVRTYELGQLEASYVDACHICFRARQALRQPEDTFRRFQAELGPDQMYGEA